MRVLRAHNVGVDRVQASLNSPLFEECMLTLTQILSKILVTIDCGQSVQPALRLAPVNQIVQTLLSAAVPSTPLQQITNICVDVVEGRCSLSAAFQEFDNVVLSYGIDSIQVEEAEEHLNRANDALMELLFLITTLSRASTAGEVNLQLENPLLIACIQSISSKDVVEAQEVVLVPKVQQTISVIPDLILTQNQWIERIREILLVPMSRFPRISTRVSAYSKSEGPIPKRKFYRVEQRADIDYDISLQRASTIFGYIKTREQNGYLMHCGNVRIKIHDSINVVVTKVLSEKEGRVIVEIARI